MAPTNKIKTYGRSNRSLVNSSVDAEKILFPRKITRKRKKPKLLIKELPTRAIGATLLEKDSFHRSTEDTFDKLLKGNVYNPINIKSHISLVNSDSDASKSIKTVSKFYSPIIRRRNKKSASLTEISSSSDIIFRKNKVQSGKSEFILKKKVNSIYSPIKTRSKSKSTSVSKSIDSSSKNKSISIPRLKEPTVDKIDVSLEVEKVRKPALDSLSYIVIPELNGEVSFDPIFTRSFRERQLIHSSTPLLPMRSKKIVNHTISPIKNVSVENSLKNERGKLNVTMPKSSSTPLKARCSVSGKNSSENSWKLLAEPRAMSSVGPQNETNSGQSHLGFESGEQIQSEAALRQLKDVINVKENHNFICSPVVQEVSNVSRQSFITLRRRKVLKLTSLGKSDSKIWENIAKSVDITDEKSNKKRKAFTLDEFNSFVDKVNSESDSQGSSHDLSDFESFEVQNKKLLDPNLRDGQSRKFVTKRHRRLTDSILVSAKKRKLNNNSSNIQYLNRLSLQESIGKKNEKPQLQDFIVLLPRIDFCFADKFLNNRSGTSNQDIQLSVSNKSSNDSSVSENDFFRLKHPILKDLAIDLTNMVFNVHPFNIDSCRVDSSIETLSDQSGSLFESSLDADKESTDSCASTACQTLHDDLTNKSVLDHEEILDVIRTSIGTREKSNSAVKDNMTETGRNTSIQNTNIAEKRDHSLNDFESFYENVTKRSRSIKRNLKSVTTEVESNQLIDSCNNDQDAEKELIVNLTKSPWRKNAIQQPKKSVLDQEEIIDVIRTSIGSQGKTKSLAKDNMTACDRNSSTQNTENEVEKRDHSLNDFENFYKNVTNSTRSFKRNLKSVSTEVESNNRRDSYNSDRDTEKELVLNLTKSPWRKNAIPPPKTNVDNTVIDLTESIDDMSARKSSGANELSLKQESVVEYQKHSISDIIESSVLSPSQVDSDGFRVPGSRRRQSKTMVLKAGKLWRRSLSMYQRSSMMLNALNEGVCKLAGGSFCLCPKCSLARQCMRMSNRRLSIRIVPARTSCNSRDISILENYAQNTSYVSDRILENNLEGDLRSLSLTKRKTSVIENSAPITAKELVLKRCGQEEPLPFEECYPKSILQNCQKIGEGVYGEVFLFKNPNGGTSVMKVIPIEGDLIVNGERQKKFEEILSEITIALELSNLRDNKQNKTRGFSQVQKVCCVQGRYPEKLIYLWELYDETRGSENDSPEIFGDDQLYIVLQLANGGKDLEAFIFNNSLQAYTMFQQVACSLAVAEEELGFEHRDLHWGNVLLSPVDKNTNVTFRLEGRNFDIMTKGVEVAIIDFTLSRIECDGVVIFNDLSLDPDLFTAEGDYQFEIYKLMQKKNGNNWQRFEPYSNVLWLHYILDKAITALRYKNTQTKVHKEYLGKLGQLKNEILNYSSVKQFVLENF